MRSAGGGDSGGFGFPTWKPLPGWRRKSVIVRLQIVLQNNTGSDGIDSALAIRLSLSTKILLSLYAGERLILKCQARRDICQLSRKPLNIGGLSCRLARLIARVADDNHPNTSIVSYATAIRTDGSAIATPIRRSPTSSAKYVLLLFIEVKYHLYPIRVIWC